MTRGGGSGHGCSGLLQQARNVAQIQELGRGHRPGPYTALQDTANALQGHTLSQDICKDSDVAKDREAAEALDSF